MSQSASDGEIREGDLVEFEADGWRVDGLAPYGRGRLRGKVTAIDTFRDEATVVCEGRDYRNHREPQQITKALDKLERVKFAVVWAERGGRRHYVEPGRWKTLCGKDVSGHHGHPISERFADCERCLRLTSYERGDQDDASAQRELLKARKASANVISAYITAAVFLGAIVYSTITDRGWFIFFDSTGTWAVDYLLPHIVGAMILYGVVRWIVGVLMVAPKDKSS